MTDGRRRELISLPVDRQTLAKRRWRGVAEDGREFGFDLEHALSDGDVYFEGDAARYVIAQKPEPVLEVSMSESELSAAAFARIGWSIGNLHFQIEITSDVIRVADDSALRQLFERELIPFVETVTVFHPLGGGHHHH
jgi:urease accessory protein